MQNALACKACKVCKACTILLHVMIASILRQATCVRRLRDMIESVRLTLLRDKSARACVCDFEIVSRCVWRQGPTASFSICVRRKSPTATVNQARSNYMFPQNSFRDISLIDGWQHVTVSRESRGVLLDRRQPARLSIQ